MAKIKVLKLIEVSHPATYNEDRLRWEDLYCRVLKLSEAKELARYIRLEEKPYIIATIASTPDNDMYYGKEKMRVFAVFSPHKGK